MHTPMLLDNYSQKTSLIKQISLNEKFSVINLIKGWRSRSGEERWVVCVCRCEGRCIPLRENSVPVWFQCAKFRESRAIMGLMGLVLSCQFAFMGISLVQKFFSWVFRGSNFFRKSDRKQKYINTSQTVYSISSLTE